MPSHVLIFLALILFLGRVSSDVDMDSAQGRLLVLTFAISIVIFTYVCMIHAIYPA